MLIRRAYGLQIYQVVNGPKWLDTDRFDIEAKAPPAEPPASPADVLFMLRSLLSERFQLKGHVESAEMPTYVLSRLRPTGPLGRGLQPSKLDCETGLPATTPLAPPRQLSSQPTGRDTVCDLRVGTGAVGTTMTNKGISIRRFAEILQPSLGRMVVDETGLSGRFDIEIEYHLDPVASGLPQPPGPPPAQLAPSLPEALKEQLGLKLEPRRGPVEVLVVDRAEPPSPN